jgi:pyrrolysine biosynthesis protein PylD
LTRLTTENIQGIARDLPAYESSLIKKTGCSLRQIACRAMGVSENEIRAAMERALVGVVPMTSGDGILEEFCETVAGIARHIGCRAFVTRKTDASGIAEAVEEKAGILMFADEDRFVALDMQRRKLVDNSDATGRGFATALLLMARCLKDRKVLVLGCGPVGRSAVKSLVKRGCRISVYDIEPAAYETLTAGLKNEPNVEVQFLHDLDSALCQHELMIDASPASNFILAQHIRPDTIISAPGVPPGLDRSALDIIGDRLLHDPLQIGVATMVVGALI